MPRTDPDYDARLNQVFEAKGSADIDYLIGALSDPDFRFIAAKFLGEMGANEATPQLLRLLDAHDPKIRSVAATVLGQLQAREAIPRLIEIAADDTRMITRTWAVQALGRMNDPRVILVLAACVRDENWPVRRAAAVALGNYPNQEALTALTDAMRAERWTRRSSIDGQSGRFAAPACADGGQAARSNFGWVRRRLGLDVERTSWQSAWHSGWAVVTTFMPVLVRRSSARASAQRCGVAAAPVTVAFGFGCLTIHSHLAVSIGWSGTTGARS